MNRYLVIGASGHIGNTLVRTLLARRYDVAAVVHSENSKALACFDVPLFIGDITDERFVNSTIKPGDIVIHCAGVIAITGVGKKNVFNTNINGTMAIAKACIANKAKRLVYVSSVDIFSDKGEGIITEPKTIEPDKLKSNYAVSKAKATIFILDMAKSGQLDACVVYPSAIIGPNDYNVSNVGQVIDDFVKNMPMARVKGGYNFVDVRDVADGIIAAAEKGRSGESYILSGENVSVDELFSVLCGEYGRKMPPRLPLKFVSAFTWLVIAYYSVRGKKPVFSRYALKTLNSNSKYCCAKAKEDLSYTYRSASESILDTAKWFIQYGKQKKHS